MQYVLDIAALAFVVLFAVVGARKGLVKACADFLGGVLAMIGAGILSTPAAEWVFDTFFRTSLEEKIAGTVSGLSAGEAVQKVFDAFPEIIQRALTAAGITQGSVVAQIQSGTESLAVEITDAISPMLVGLISALTMVVLFVVLLVVIRAIAVLLTGLFELPVLHGVNTSLGGLFGVLLSVPVLWVIFACVRALTPVLAQDMQVYVQTLMDHSYLAGIFYKFNPVLWLLG